MSRFSGMNVVETRAVMIQILVSFGQKGLQRALCRKLGVLLLVLAGCGGASVKKEAEVVLPAKLGDLLPVDMSVALRVHLAQLRKTQSYPSIRNVMVHTLANAQGTDAVDVGEILDRSNEFVMGVSYDANAQPTTIMLLRGQHDSQSLNAFAIRFDLSLRAEFLAKDVWVIASQERIAQLRKRLDDQETQHVALKLLREKYGFDETLLCLVVQGTPEVQARISKDSFFANVPFFRQGPLPEVLTHFQRMGLRMDIDETARVNLGFHVASSELAQGAAAQAKELVARYRANFLVMALGLRPVFDNASIYATDGQLLLTIEVPENDAAVIASRFSDLSKLSRKQQ